MNDLIIKSAVAVITAEAAPGRFQLAIIKRYSQPLIMQFTLHQKIALVKLPSAHPVSLH
jgi:hypothetical protein